MSDKPYLFIEKLNVVDKEPEEPQLKWDMSKPSLALIASNGDRRAVILEWTGGHLAYFMEADVEWTHDQLFDGAPEGLRVWEGKITSHRYYEGDYDYWLDGVYRELNTEEWLSLQAGRDLWPLAADTVEDTLESA